MARKRELATTFDNQPNKRMIANSETRPDTLIEALMQCPPGIDPDPSREELLPLRDILQDAIDKLTPEEQWVFDALTTRRLSYRELGRELSIPKSTVERMRERILTKLRTSLIEHEEVRRYLA